MWLAIRKFIPLAVWRKSWRRSLARTRDISRWILPLETYSFMAHIWLKNTIQVFPGPGAQWYSQHPFHLLAWFTPCGPHFPTVFLFTNSSSFTLHLPSGKQGSLYGYVNGCLDWPWLTLIRSCAHSEIVTVAKGILSVDWSIWITTMWSWGSHALVNWL